MRRSASGGKKRRDFHIRRYIHERARRTSVVSHYASLSEFVQRANLSEFPGARQLVPLDRIALAEHVRRKIFCGLFNGPHAFNFFIPIAKMISRFTFR